MKPSACFLSCMLMAPAWAADRPAAEGAKVTDFIRVEEDAAKARLQTAVTRYEKDGARLDLVGAIHIADAGYFRALNERFAAHDAVLFEMIGGESLAARNADKSDKSDPSDSSDQPAEQEKNLEALHQVYGMVARFLGLTDQMNRVDYTKENFVHADLSLAEFRKLQAERGESLLGFALEAGRQAGEQGAAKQPDTARLLQAMLTGNSNQLKLEIVHSLGAGDDQIAAFAGESVIIGDRNRKCLQVLAEQVAAGRRKLAIFYGAAHFPDMERRLLEAGWKRTTQEWLTAWDIPKEPAVKEPKKAA